MDAVVPSSVDAVVVGARGAGAATAMLLARAGRTVLLIDRGEYGTDILSTHALMRGGGMQLARWNLLERIIAAGTPPVTVTTFHVGTERLRVDIKPKFGVSALYAPRRTVLDRTLVDGAAEAGAVVRYGTRLTALSRTSDGTVDGVFLQDRAGQTMHVHAKHVVGIPCEHRCGNELDGSDVAGAVGLWPNRLTPSTTAQRQVRNVIFIVILWQ
jgi:flavin-dependent dehydrogenase